MTDAKETARKWAAEQIEDWEHRATQAEGECLNRSAALYRRDAEHLRALLAGEGPVRMIDPMEAACIVERVITEWGKQDSLRDMLDEITAELARPSSSPSPAVRDGTGPDMAALGKLHRGLMFDHVEEVERLRSVVADLEHRLAVRDAPLREALDTLSKMHLGDCPAAMDQLAHARAHIYEMRKLAANALSATAGKP